MENARPALARVFLVFPFRFDLAFHIRLLVVGKPPEPARPGIDDVFPK